MLTSDIDRQILRMALLVTRKYQKKILSYDATNHRRKIYFLRDSVSRLRFPRLIIIIYLLLKSFISIFYDDSFSIIVL